MLVFAGHARYGVGVADLKGVGQPVGVAEPRGVELDSHDLSRFSLNFGCRTQSRVAHELDVRANLELLAGRRC